MFVVAVSKRVGVAVKSLFEVCCAPNILLLLLPLNFCVVNHICLILAITFKWTFVLVALLTVTCLGGSGGLLLICVEDFGVVGLDDTFDVFAA